MVVTWGSRDAANLRGGRKARHDDCRGTAKLRGSERNTLRGAQATPWVQPSFTWLWFPADAVTTPFSFADGPNLAMANVDPRTLNDPAQSAAGSSPHTPVFCMFSSFKYTWPPVWRENALERWQGVRLICPTIRGHRQPRPANLALQHLLSLKNKPRNTSP